MMTVLLSNFGCFIWENVDLVGSGVVITVLSPTVRYACHLENKPANVRYIKHRLCSREVIFSHIFKGVL